MSYDLLLGCVIVWLLYLLYYYNYVNSFVTFPLKTLAKRRLKGCLRYILSYCVIHTIANELEFVDLSGFLYVADVHIPYSAYDQEMHGLKYYKNIIVKMKT